MGADDVIIIKLIISILKNMNTKFDLLISTVNVNLNWDLYLNALEPRGRLHFVGAVLEPIKSSVFTLMAGRRSISGSPVGKSKKYKKNARLLC